MASLKATEILLWVSAAGFAASCVWAVSDIKKGTFKKESIVNGVMLAAIFAVLLGSVLLIKIDHNLAGRLLYIIIPGIAILHLIYSSYQREFFWFSLSTSAAVCMIWIMAKAPDTKAAILAALFVPVVCAMEVFAFNGSYKNGGVLSLGKLRVKMSEADGVSQLAVYAVNGFTVLMAAAAYMLGAPYAYYALYALAGVFMAAAVYYTVKLI